VAPVSRKRDTSALPSNYLMACLLLLVAETPSHGYELLDRARELLPVPLDGGRLYRQLRTMEHDGLVASSWKGSGSGPDRRVYLLTAGGRARLQGIAEALAEAEVRIDAYLSRLARVPGRRSAAA